MIQATPPEKSALRIAVIGLGYVGLPLAVEFGNRYPTVGFDVDQSKVGGPQKQAWPV